MAQGLGPGCKLHVAPSQGQPCVLALGPVQIGLCQSHHAMLSHRPLHASAPQTGPLCHEHQVQPVHHVLTPPQSLCCLLWLCTHRQPGTWSGGVLHAVCAPCWSPGLQAARASPHTACSTSPGMGYCGLPEVYGACTGHALHVVPHQTGPGMDRSGLPTGPWTLSEPMGSDEFDTPHPPKSLLD